VNAWGERRRPRNTPKIEEEASPAKPTRNRRREPRLGIE